MDFQYLAYTSEKKMIKGQLAAPDEEKAVAELNAIGYQVLNIKSRNSLGKLSGTLNISLTSQVKPREVILFSRQLAILLESGIDIVTAIDLYKAQASNKIFQKTLEEMIADLRSGTSFSGALAKFPKVFSTMYCRTIAAGEQSGNLDQVLRRMADYMERTASASKKVKSAMTYPIIVLSVAIVVVAVLVFFVMPTYTNLYSSLGAKLPTISKILIDFAKGAAEYGGYVLLGLAVLIIGMVLYFRTPSGKIRWDGYMLRLPIIGPIVQLNELSRCARTISMLIKVGLPLPDIVAMCIQSSGNKVVGQALNEVKQEMLAGEGLAQPMSKRKIFLPLMVQMVAVGEKTGNLGNTLTTAADSFEADADEKTMTAVGLLQPALTIAMAVVVGFIVIAMLSAMYGIYGQFGSG
ncbi:MAG: type II secretion system F family protein [Dehalococcoidales bacterium]|jgi:type IV pilus assembly protein PilC